VGHMKEAASMEKFDKILIGVIENEHPVNLEKAVELARLKFSTGEKVIMNGVLHACLKAKEKYCMIILPPLFRLL
jgi:hypothetical protein